MIVQYKRSPFNYKIDNARTTARDIWWMLCPFLFKRAHSQSRSKPRRLEQDVFCQKKIPNFNMFEVTEYIFRTRKERKQPTIQRDAHTHPVKYLKCPRRGTWITGGGTIYLPWEWNYSFLHSLLFGPTAESSSGLIQRLRSHQANKIDGRIFLIIVSIRWEPRFLFIFIINFFIYL